MYFQWISTLYIQHSHAFYSLGFSLVTNMVVMDVDSGAEGPNHEEVLETGRRRALDMQKLVKGVVSKITLT